MVVQFLVGHKRLKPEVCLKKKEKNVKLKLEDKKIAVILDERCDDEARSFLSVLFKPLEPAC